MTDKDASLILASDMRFLSDYALRDAVEFLTAEKVLGAITRLEKREFRCEKK